MNINDMLQAASTTAMTLLAGLAPRDELRATGVERELVDDAFTLYDVYFGTTRSTRKQAEARKYATNNKLGFSRLRAIERAVAKLRDDTHSWALRCSLTGFAGRNPHDFTRFTREQLALYNNDTPPPSRAPRFKVTAHSRTGEASMSMRGNAGTIREFEHQVRERATTAGTTTGEAAVAVLQDMINTATASCTPGPTRDVGSGTCGDSTSQQSSTTNTATAGASAMRTDTGPKTTGYATSASATSTGVSGVSGVSVAAAAAGPTYRLRIMVNLEDVEAILNGEQDDCLTVANNGATMRLSEALAKKLDGVVEFVGLTPAHGAIGLAFGDNPLDGWDNAINTCAELEAEQARRAAAGEPLIPQEAVDKALSRFGTAKDRALLEANQTVCAGLGCSVPAVYCQINHNIPYSKGGLSVLSNMCLLCKYHNGTAGNDEHYRNVGGITYRVLPGGRLAANDHELAELSPVRRWHHQRGSPAATPAPP